MNTRIVMTSSALVLGVAGIVFTFAPDVILSSLGIAVTGIGVLLGQVVGALYFGFAMLNWMVKGNLIGGIYNRPIAVANMSHFVIAGLAVVKVLISTSNVSMMLWVAGVMYVILGLTFAVILFRHPIVEK